MQCDAFLAVVEATSSAAYEKGNSCVDATVFNSAEYEGRMADL